MIYTTQGLMTAADMADLADLYDWNHQEQEEEEAMEAAHAAHADECQACQEEASQRETTARVALQMDTARRALEDAIQRTLRSGLVDSPGARRELERGLKEARAALRNI